MNLDFFYDFEHWRQRKISLLLFVSVSYLLMIILIKVFKVDEKTAVILGFTVSFVFFFHAGFAWRLNFGKIIIDLFQ